MAVMAIGLRGSGDAEDAPPKETITLDVTEQQVKQFKVGQKVTVTVKGTVGHLSVPRYDNPTPDNPPTMGIKVDSKTINGKSTQQQGIEDLATDNDEEPDVADANEAAEGE